jgi:hypothetical protein
MVSGDLVSSEVNLGAELRRRVYDGGSKAALAREFGISRDALGYHLKTGHTLSVQNRPTGLAEDVIVLPCRSVDLQGVA